MALALSSPRTSPEKRRPHRARRPQLLTRDQLDGRTNAAKLFDRSVVDIEGDLGGHDQLSTIERALVEAFAGACVTLQHLNTKLALGQEIDLGQHAQAVSAMVRVASRLGVQRRAKDVSTPSVQEYLAHSQAAGGGVVRPTTTLRDALSDPHLLGHVLAGDTWLPWRVLLIAAMGEALTDDERVIFTKLTGRAREPLIRVDLFAGIIGRRGGKTTAMSCLSTYLSACCDHRDALARGENGVLLCLAQDQRVAKQLLERIEAYLTDSPILRQLIKSRTQDSIELSNNISIEVRPASFRRLRGPTY